MKKDYEYYIKVIKPIEKKYTRLCILNKFIKSKKINNSINYYNKLLRLYYHSIKNNKNIIKEFK
jgi:hypothetical protein